MIRARCHCGDVKLEAPSAPEQVFQCNCSICSRIGGLWAYYDPADITILSGPETIDGYVWGDQTLRI